MADDDGGVGPSSSDSSNLSEAEKRRLRRRQRILDNQGTRLQKILGSDGSQTQGSSLTTDANIVQDDLTASPLEIFRKSLDSEGISSSSTSRNSAFSTSVHSHTNNEENQEGRRSSNISTLLQELSNQNLSEEQHQESTVTATDDGNGTGTRMGVQNDGTVLLPRLGTYYGRILLCVLAIFLSLFNAKQYMVTFLSWEVAFYWLNGLPPMPPLNMAMVLVAVMGLKEAQLNKIKKVTHIFNCIAVDLSIYLTMVLLPHVVSSFVRDLR